MKRKTFSRVIQCATGHAHLGSYYAKFIRDENQGCPCGAILQTREHVLLNCEEHETHRHLLTDEEGTLSLEAILSTGKGLERLATFIEASGAFSKPPDPELERY
jgi:hypothetical protein